MRSVFLVCNTLAGFVARRGVARPFELLILILLLGTRSAAVGMEWVPVGDAGNAARSRAA